jgi:hypothetical protein
MLTQQLFLTPKLGEEKLGEDTAQHEDSNSCSCSEKKCELQEPDFTKHLLHLNL